MKQIHININTNRKVRALLAITLLSCSSELMAQQPIIGYITDNKGNALTGVSAVLKHDDQKIKVNALGQFTVKQKTSDTLVLRKDGYYGKQVPLDPVTGSTLRIMLDPVKPYDEQLQLPFNNTIQRKYYTGSVNGTTGEQMAGFRTSNNSNALAGKIPGLTTIMGNDEPGYDASLLLIRGKSSYNNDAINTYVDNIPVGFNQLDPLEIDQVQVFKDGVANGVYGMRGANKSIFVTTKRGEAFNNQINVYTAFGFQEAVALPKFLGSQQYMKLVNEGLQNDGLPARYTQAQIDAYNTTQDPYLYPDADWYGANLVPSAGFQKYNLSLSGGNNTARYFILGGLNRQSGLYRNTGVNFSQYGYNTNQQFDRYNIRSNFDFTINKNLTAFADLSGRIEEKTNPGIAEDPANIIFTNMATYPSNLFPVTFSDGKIGGNAQYANNPYGLITARGNIKLVNRITFGNIGIRQNLSGLVNGLSFSAAYSFYNSFYNIQGFYSGSPSFAVYQMVGGVQQSFNKDVLPTFSVGSGLQNRIGTFWGKLDYATAWGNQHELSTSVGYTQSKNTPAGDNFPYVSVNLFNQTHYQYKKRYLADFGLSYSASEIFPPGHRFGLFPSIGAGWILSEESFMKQHKAISFLKLRASYAMLGNADLGVGVNRGRYLYIDQYTNTGTQYYFGQTPTAASGYAAGTIPNENVRWEKQTMVNLGVDATFFKNTLGVSAEIFNERRSGILAVPGNISSLIGQTIAALNVGSVNNRGIDFSLWYANNAGKLNYKLTGNLSLAKNKILYMSEATQAYPYLYRTGNAIGTVFGLEAVGFFKDAADVNASPRQLYSVVQPGDIKYKDQNGDGVVDSQDNIAIGKPGVPETVYGLTIDLSYKQFTFSATLQGAANYSVDLRSYATFGLYNGARPSELMLDRWTPQTAATATYPRLGFATANNYQTSTFWIQKASYLRLKSVEFGYNFPAGLLNRLHLKGARIFISGFNLLTWDNIGIQYMDPEYTAAGISDYPRLKNTTFGLNINL